MTESENIFDEREKHMFRRTALASAIAAALVLSACTDDSASGAVNTNAPADNSSNASNTESNMPVADGFTVADLPSDDTFTLAVGDPELYTSIGGRAIFCLSVQYALVSEPAEGADLIADQIRASLLLNSAVPMYGDPSFEDRTVLSYMDLLDADEADPAVGEYVVRQLCAYIADDASEVVVEWAVHEPRSRTEIVTYEM